MLLEVWNGGNCGEGEGWGVGMGGKMSLGMDVLWWRLFIEGKDEVRPRACVKGALCAPALPILCFSSCCLVTVLDVGGLQ